MHLNHVATPYILRINMKKQGKLTMNIRPATADDAGTIFGFIKELAEYEQALECVEASQQDIIDSLFTEQATAKALICEYNGQAIGYAVYFFNYSTWLGKNGLYLEDLYVTPAHRGVGAGKSLMQFLAKLAVEQHCGRFEWSVLDWNQPAIDFYQYIGAKEQSEWRTYRLTGGALFKFAEG